MTEPTPDYRARAAMYRLLVGYAAMAFTNDEQGPAVYRATLDSTLADDRLRDIVNTLAGVAIGGYIEKYNGDLTVTMETIVRELRAAEDLASLDHPQRD